MLRAECQNSPDVEKLQMTASPGLAQDALQLYPYGNSGRQRAKSPALHFQWNGSSVVLIESVDTLYHEHPEWPLYQAFSQQRFSAVHKLPIHSIPEIFEC